MPYKYGPGDPEFLNRETDAEARPTAYLDGFRRKWAAIDCLVVGAAGVAALVLGWDFARFAGAVALGGVGTIGLGMLLFMGNQSFVSGGAGRMSNDPIGPRLPVDHWARRVAVLMLVAGLSLALGGVALLLVP